jgi:hypothetical protein
VPQGGLKDPLFYCIIVSNLQSVPVVNPHHIMTLNTHQQHPEDMILTGDLSVIDELYGDAFVSVKIDGSPAVVWGTHPENGEFFVGTKSVFNKKKIRICYTEENIREYYNHQPNVETILINCLNYLPRTEGVFQGDFIGFGGNTSYKPNTIEYVFDEIVTENIIIAPHTYYTGDCPLYEMEAHSLEGDLCETNDCKFVQPFVDRVNCNITAPVIDPNYYTFLTEKEACQAKVAINALIRSGQKLHEVDLIDILGSLRLANLYLLVVEMKEELMEDMIVYNCPKSYIGGLKVNQEGFVMSTEYGMIKLVDREQFSLRQFRTG